jgi:hypothetical protein
MGLLPIEIAPPVKMTSAAAETAVRVCIQMHGASVGGGVH